MGASLRVRAGMAGGQASGGDWPDLALAAAVEGARFPGTASLGRAGRAPGSGRPDGGAAGRTGS